MRVGWPRSAEELEALQRELAALRRPPWRPEPGASLLVAGAFVASATGLVGTGAEGDPLWAGAVAARAGDAITSAVVRERAGGPYVPGLLALREGEVLERAVRALSGGRRRSWTGPTGTIRAALDRVAPRRGADVPTVGVTVRPLVATPVEPDEDRGASAPIVVDGEVVGHAVRTRRGARPVYAHAGWQTDPDVAREVVLLVTGRYRTPEPIRLARRLARRARARDEGRAPAGPEHENLTNA
jgi:deoxyribonuclease V